MKISFKKLKIYKNNNKIWITKFILKYNKNIKLLYFKERQKYNYINYLNVWFKKLKQIYIQKSSKIFIIFKIILKISQIYIFMV